MSPVTKKVLVSGAGGQIGYSLIPLVIGGQVCGPDTRIDLVLLEVPQALQFLTGVVMEIEDGAYPLLNSITVTSDVNEAFKGCDVALMIGGFPRGPGMTRGDLLLKNATIFVEAGKALEAHGSKDCKVLVVANPANTNAWIMQQQCPSIPKENFTAMTRLDHNRAISQLATKLGANAKDVTNMTIWGNHSGTMVVDTTNVRVAGAKPHLDQEWLKNTMVPTVQNRGAAIIAARGGKSSAMSAANAAANHMYNWLNGTKEGDWVSIAIVSDGQYGTTPGIVYSFPCTCKDGKFTVVEGLDISEETKAAMKITNDELVSEQKTILASKEHQ